MQNKVNGLVVSSFFFILLLGIGWIFLSLLSNTDQPSLAEPQADSPAAVVSPVADVQPVSSAADEAPKADERSLGRLESVVAELDGATLARESGVNVVTLANGKKYIPVGLQGDGIAGFVAHQAITQPNPIASLKNCEEAAGSDAIQCDDVRKAAETLDTEVFGKSGALVFDLRNGQVVGEATAFGFLTTDQLSDGALEEAERCVERVEKELPRPTYNEKNEQQMLEHLETRRLAITHCYQR